MQLPQLDEFTRFAYLSGLQASPCGRQLAFVVTTVGEGAYRQALWVSRDGAPPSPLAETGSGPFAWEEGGTLLHVPRGEGQEATATAFCRTDTEGNHQHPRPAFAVPHQVEAVRALTGGRHLLLCRVNLQEGPRECVVLEELPCRFNGEGMVSGWRRMLLVRQPDGALTCLSTPREEVVGFALSPRGDKVAFAAGRHDGIREERHSIWEVALATGEKRLLVGPDLGVSEMDYWGDALVLAASDLQTWGVGENPRLFLLEDTGLTPLTGAPQAIGETVASDCRKGGGTVFRVAEDTLYYTVLEGAFSRLYQMALPGGRPVCLTPQLDCVDCFALGARGPVAVAFRGQALQELYAVEPGGCRQLTHLNPSPADLWRALPRRHTLGRGDDVEIDGWALLPPDFAPDRRYPAILNIHGGPKAAYGEIYFHEMQVWAARGYIVLFCNPRGSDGKGEPFADVRGDWGGRDADDLLAFLEEMLACYPIDPGRVGVAGGSYGGYMVNWLIGRTNRFAAAVSQRGIANLLDFFGTSDVGYYLVEDQLRANPWKDPAKLWEKSPLRWAHRVVTPTLLIHALEDYRCPVTQGLQLFTALKAKGVETRLCLFPGENHELSRAGEPAARRRRLEEMTAWLDKYLAEQ